MIKIIKSSEFDSYWQSQTINDNDEATESTVKEIIAAVRKEGDTAVKRYASKFDRSSPENLEVPISEAKNALKKLRESDPELTEALQLSAQHILRFSEKQKEQFINFEYEMEKGLITGQRVIPVGRAAVYIPGGRFPLFSSVLMCMIPAFCAGVEEVILSSPPSEDGKPNQKVLAAAAIAAEVFGANDGRLRIFSIGGAQAIAALAYGTQSVPRSDIIVGPGNKFVAAAKRLVYGQAGIDFIAGPSDVLVICDGKEVNGGFNAADLVAVDMIAQAEHDPDARARALVPNMEFANSVCTAIEKHIAALPTAAMSSLQNSGLIVVYQNREEAICIANTIAPEHLELQTADTQDWIPHLKNYGSLFAGTLCAEVLGDYSAGINHTLPTSGSARYTGGLSVRHFLKTVTTLRCPCDHQDGGHPDGCYRDSGYLDSGYPDSGYLDSFEKARNAAEVLAKAEGLFGHALSAASRRC